MRVDASAQRAYAPAFGAAHLSVIFPLQRIFEWQKQNEVRPAQLSRQCRDNWLVRESGHGYRALLAVLTLTHDQEAVLGVHVLQAQVRGFLPADGTRIQHFEDHPITVASSRLQIGLRQDALNFRFVQDCFR
jgi:hypothetical protein